MTNGRYVYRDGADVTFARKQLCLVLARWATVGINLQEVVT